MMYLLDTQVVWELRSARAGLTDPALAGWAVGQARTSLFLSALTIAELAAGALQVDRTDKAAAAAIRRWIEGPVTAAFDGRVVAVDAAVARRAMTLGYPDLRDGLMAATALEHGLTLATRQPSTFKTGKVKTFNPWGYAPDAPDDDDWRQAARGGPLWLKNLFVRG